MHLNLPNTHSNGLSLKMMGNKNISLGVAENFDILRQPGHDIDPPHGHPFEGFQKFVNKAADSMCTSCPKETLRNLGDFPIGE